MVFQHRNTFESYLRNINSTFALSMCKVCSNHLSSLTCSVYFFIKCTLSCAQNYYKNKKASLCNCEISWLFIYFMWKHINFVSFFFLYISGYFQLEMKNMSLCWNSISLNYHVCQSKNTFQRHCIAIKILDM